MKNYKLIKDFSYNLLLTKGSKPCTLGEYSHLNSLALMVRTASTMLPLGTTAPAFELPDVVSGAKISVDSFADKKALLVMFISVHCPFVKHIQTELALLGKDYSDYGLGIVGISPNDAVKYPDDSPESLKEMAKTLGITYPICYDETQQTAIAYTAACTPDFFLFNADRQLCYRGQLDDSRPSNGKPVTGKDLRAAIVATLSGEMVDVNQRPSIGCNIKWVEGNAPEYFTGVRAEEE
jgi:peroxiredoxin